MSHALRGIHQFGGKPSFPTTHQLGGNLQFPSSNPYGITTIYGQSPQCFVPQFVSIPSVQRTTPPHFQKHVPTPPKNRTKPIKKIVPQKQNKSKNEKPKSNKQTSSVPTQSSLHVPNIQGPNHAWVPKQNL